MREIGYRPVPHAAEQQCADDDERPLVDGAWCVVRLHARRLAEADERTDVQAQPDVVGDGIAEVDGHCPGAVPVEHGPQHALAFGEGVVP
jgi:hypothetical protein